MEKLTLDSSCCFNHHLLEASVMLWRWGGAVCLCQSQPCCLFSILSWSDAFPEALSRSQEEGVTPWLFRQGRDVLCVARWGVYWLLLLIIAVSFDACQEWLIMNLSWACSESLCCRGTQGCLGQQWQPCSFLCCSVLVELCAVPCC